jgi:hypothetical protein
MEAITMLPLSPRLERCVSLDDQASSSCRRVWIHLQEIEPAGWGHHKMWSDRHYIGQVFFYGLKKAYYIVFCIGWRELLTRRRRQEIDNTELEHTHTHTHRYRLLDHDSVVQGNRVLGLFLSFNQMLKSSIYVHHWTYRCIHLGIIPPVVVALEMSAKWLLGQLLLTA